MMFASEMNRGFGLEKLGYILSLNNLGINHEHPVTKNIQQLFLPACGSFTGEIHAGIRATRLLTGTKESMLVSSEKILFSSREDNLRMNAQFNSDKDLHTLAYMLEGQFHSFVTEDPLDMLKNSKILLLGDADMIADPYAVQQYEVQGKTLYREINGNLALIFNALDYMQNKYASE